jgi:NurA domain
MAINSAQIQAILNRKRDDFSRFDTNTVQDLQIYQTAWQTLAQLPSETLTQWFQQHVGHVGARVLEPFSGQMQVGIHRCGLQWGSREESMQWVKSQLANITTFAVDGSQIFPSKDLSIPIALVQIGWFENPHTGDGKYTKDIELDVMTPSDLRAWDLSQPPERRVNMRRFEMETQRLVRYIQQVPNPETCLVFFDGSLVATFADAFEESMRDLYVQALLNVLRASEQYRVPLVGYVDTSYAHDLTTLLEKQLKLEPAASIHDAQILNRFMQWGDCTGVWLCDRTGILSDYQEHAERLTFSYLKTNQSYPARLEMPLWMHEAGITDQVMNWVRAEVIVGSGYPYAIETADQTAVLQNQDRQIFFQVLQSWAETQSLGLRLSRKMMSKARRR